MNGIHLSHDWVHFDESEPPQNQFCNSCGICSCHSSDGGTQPCTGEVTS